MRNQRFRAIQNKEGLRGSNPNDFISQMSDDILLKILYLLPIKDAVVTSVLSTRWRFVWCNLISLKFDARESLAKIAKDPKLWVTEAAKYVNQVNNILKSYDHPKVQDFRICFDLDTCYHENIDKWLEFAVDKKVEILELDLKKTTHRNNYRYAVYCFPLHLPNMCYLRKLYIKSVNLSDAILQEILRNSPYLDTLSIHHIMGPHLTRIDVGGKGLNLKHLEIMFCFGVTFISMYDFNLEIFNYKGPGIEIQFTDLPKLKEVEMSQGAFSGLNNVFGQISSIVSSLQALSLHILSPKDSFKCIDELPNVKKLTLTVAAHKDDCLLEYVSIANACPSLESLTVKLLWFRPVRSSRKAGEVATDHHHEHLKLFKILGYFGRTSDLELATYIIHNAVALKKIVIDPRYQGSATTDGFSKREQASRSFAERQLIPICPQGVELAIL